MQYNLYMKTSVDIFTDPVGRMPYIRNDFSGSGTIFTLSLNHHHLVLDLSHNRNSERV